MIEFLQSYLWLQARMLRNGLYAARDLGRVERLSRGARVLLPLVLAAFLLPAAVALAAVSWFAGETMTELPATALLFEDVAGGLGLALTFTLLLVPLLRSVAGGTTDLTRLLLLPVSRARLHFCELVVRWADPWLLLVTPALVALPAAMAAGGAPRSAALAAAATAFLALSLASLRLIITLVLKLALRTRQRAELAYLAVVALVSLLPILLYLPGGPIGRAVRSQPVAQPGTLLPGYAAVFPPVLYARAIGLGARGETADALGHLALLAAVSAALCLASRRLFDRVADGGGTTGRSRVARDRRTPLLGLPGVDPARAAVARVHVTQFVRTVRGKTVLFITPVVVVLTGFFIAGALGGERRTSFSGGGEILALVGVLLTVTSLQDVSVNQFAADRGGLEREWLAPLSAMDLVTGKAIGGILLAATASLPSLALIRGIRPGTPIAALAAVFLVGLSTMILHTPACALLSIYLPKGGEDRRSASGSIHPLASFAGGLIALALAVPAVGLLVASNALFDGLLAPLVVLSGWTVVAILIAWSLLGLAAGALESRRETLFLISRG